MDRKEIQEQRMKGYFVQATKDLLRSEGLRSINVRSIAEKAGYSYATMYNYFKDINDLIFICVKDFQDECEEFIKGKISKKPRGKEKIKATVTAYADFFIEYPGIFELFFIERMSDIGNKKTTSELIYTFLDRLCEEEWSYCSTEKEMSDDDIARIKNSIHYLVIGVLLFYLNRLQPATYNEFISNRDRLMSEIFDTAN